jgi:hypothetical protein
VRGDTESCMVVGEDWKQCVVFCSIRRGSVEELDGMPNRGHKLLL